MHITLLGSFNGFDPHIIVIIKDMNNTKMKIFNDKMQSDPVQ